MAITAHDMQMASWILTGKARETISTTAQPGSDDYSLFRERQNVLISFGPCHRAPTLQTMRVLRTGTWRGHMHTRADTHTLGRAFTESSKSPDFFFFLLLPQKLFRVLKNLCSNALPVDNYSLDFAAFLREMNDSCKVQHKLTR